MKKLLYLCLFCTLAFTSGCSHSNNTPTPAPTTASAPSAPTGVTATAGTSQVVLSWTASSGATSYNIYFGTTTGVTTTSTNKISAIAATTYTQTGLTNGTAYFYIVTAVNSTGESTASSQATATPLPPAPTAPTALTASPGNAQVSLSWTAGTNVATYNLYYATTPGVTAATGTKVTGLTGTSYMLGSLINGTTYYFVLTSVNLAGESAVSNQATATPTVGITVNLVPGTATAGTLQASATTSLTFNFAANAVSQNATATIGPVAQAALPVPLIRSNMANAKVAPRVQATDTFVTAFTLGLSPTTITQFNVPVNISGSVGAVIPVGKTLNLAILSNNAWVDIATFVIGSGGAINQNIASLTLPGLLGPGTYLVYQPAAGTSTAISNLGVVLIADDGHGMADGSGGIQVVRVYDSAGNLLSKPTVTYLDYANAYDLDGEALTPDGSQGIMVDGGNTVRFFSQVQTGVPLASTTTVDISAYGSDGDSVAILPTGDEAIVSGDDQKVLLVISGIIAGKPVAAATIPIPSNRDGVVVSNDGKVLLARGGTGMTVYSIASIAPVAGSVGGTVSHSYTQVVDFATLGTNYYAEDGRNGMAISPTDSSRAVVITSSGAGSTVQLATGLTTTPVAGTALSIASGLFPYSVSVSPDGKYAIVGTSGGLLFYSGVDTGTLTQVGSTYAPTYTLGTGSVKLGSIKTLGITLDGKYVLAGDQTNASLVVIGYTSAGFAAAPSSVLGSLAIPDNDQLLVH